jgi:hypothetical protein
VLAAIRRAGRTPRHGEAAGREADCGWAAEGPTVERSGREEGRRAGPSRPLAAPGRYVDGLEGAGRIMGRNAPHAGGCRSVAYRRAITGALLALGPYFAVEENRSEIGWEKD